MRKILSIERFAIWPDSSRSADKRTPPSAQRIAIARVMGLPFRGRLGFGVGRGKGLGKPVRGGSWLIIGQPRPLRKVHTSVAISTSPVFVVTLPMPLLGWAIRYLKSNLLIANEPCPAL